MNPTLLTNIRKRLLLRTVLVNDYYKYKIYNIVTSGNKYKFYRGNATLIGIFSYREIENFLKGDSLFYDGNVIKLLPKTQLDYGRNR